MIHGRFLHFEADPHEFEVGSRSAYESDRTLILFGRFKARITAEDETVLLEGYTQEFALVAGTTRYGEKCCAAGKNQ